MTAPVLEHVVAVLADYAPAWMSARELSDALECNPSLVYPRLKSLESAGWAITDGGRPARWKIKDGTAAGSSGETVVRYWDGDTERVARIRAVTGRRDADGREYVTLSGGVILPRGVVRTPDELSRRA